jgi:hypothetical protein
VRQRAGVGSNIDRRHQQPLGGAGLGLHEAIDVLPLIARVDARTGRLPPASPDAAQDRLQPYAVFVFGPELDRRVRVRLLEGLHAGGEALGKAA